MLTMKQFQTPTKHAITTKYLVKNTDTCFKCQAVNDEAIHGSHHTLYASKSQIFCIDCWDGESWECPHCCQTPPDKDCISCFKCGQWTHNGCDGVDIDTAVNYLCNHCKYAGDIIEKLVVQKNAGITKLKVAENELLEKTQDLADLANIANKHAIDLKSYQQAMDHNSKKMAINNRLVIDLKRAKASEWTAIRELAATNSQNSDSSKKTTQQMKTLTSEKNKAIRELVAANSRNLDSSKQMSILRKEMTGLKKNVKIAQSDVINVKKRKNACDSMLDDMQKLVKKYRARWNYHAPIRLDGINLSLWKMYECKTDGTVFSCDKLKYHGSEPTWKTIGETMQEVKNYHLQTTLKSK